MQLHQIRTTQRQKKHKRIGRGGKRGTYSGRGIKGQKSRAGAKIKPQWREMIKKLPKKRGTKFKSKKINPIIVNLSVINRVFKMGETVLPRTLLDRGIIEKKKGRLPKIKILGQGKITKKINVRDCLVSSSARKKIKKAGGTIK